MRVIEDISRTVATILLLTGFVVVALGAPEPARSAEHDWLDAMMQAVLVEQAKEGPFGERFAPYVAQLTRVRAHLDNDESEGVYQAINRFMDMLEGREQGVVPEVADRLFDYCYLMTPAKYHDVSRHLYRLSEQQYGAPIG